MAGEREGAGGMGERTAGPGQDELQPSGDSPKRQGDKLGGAVGATVKAEASETGLAQDSPKRQGDKLGSSRPAR